MVTKAPLQFGVELAKKGQDLVLHYEVRNKDSRDAYLLNMLYRPGPDWLMSPDLIYIRVESEKRRLHLYKRIDDIPENRNVVCPVAPFLTPVRAGASYDEEVHMATPVEESREYSPLRAAAKPRPFLCQDVVFTLGYYWSCDGLIEEIVDIEGTPACIIRAPSHAMLEYGELNSDVVVMEVPALVRHSPETGANAARGGNLSVK